MLTVQPQRTLYRCQRCGFERTDECQVDADGQISEKPPLGCKPAELVSWGRISELAQAILRQIDASDKYRKPALVKKWANEITWQCSIIESMDDE